MGPGFWRICSFALLVAGLATTSAGRAQTAEAPQTAYAEVAAAELPDAPTARTETPDFDSASDSDSLLGSTTSGTRGAFTRKYHRVIQPDEPVGPLTSADKLKLSVMSRLTLSDVGSTLFSAGWSHVRDSAPHYGTDSGAFGERLGALALKQTTQSIFSYGIYASMFHQDPRYYVMGSRESVGVRALYSASRVFIGQKDDGSRAINWPKFAGIASAQALANTYYPAQDRGFGNGAKAFGTSLWTSIINNEIHEFIGDGIRLIKHKRNR